MLQVNATITDDIDTRGHESTNEVSRLQTSWRQTQDSRITRMADPPRFHGPYYQWSAKVNNKTVSRRLSAAEAELFQEWIDNRGELQRIIAEMQEVSAKAGELLLGQVERPSKS